MSAERTAGRRAAAAGAGEAPARESPFAVVPGTVRAVARLSPSFVRVTLAGPGVDALGTPGRTFDQRIKLIFPPPSGVLPAGRLADAGDDWYRAWLEVPEAERGSMRTYSIRELRVAADGSTELAVDFVLHLAPGATGPASRWADAARPGDELLVVGPRRGRLDGGGIEYDPGDAERIVLAGDETAAPAIARILEDTSPRTRGDAFLEIPEAGDRLPIAAPPGVRVHWLPRAGRPHGDRLLPAVLAHLGSAPVEAVRDPGGEDLLWETPRYSALGEEVTGPAERADRYYWIAGESGVVTALRRALVRELGIPRGQVAFMGYWRRGVAMKG